MDLRRYDSIIRISMVFCAFFAFIDSAVLDACTLWSAVGQRVAHGGSLIAKNRDWTPEPSQVRFDSPKAGFRSLGLFPIREGKRKGNVAGVNEKGLVIVTASASSVPKADREKGGISLTRQLLANFSTVEDVLVNKSVFTRTHPSMYLIADCRQTAWFEVAPGGRFSFRTTKRGVLTHTNHYLDEMLIDVNGKIGRSSRARLDRIGELLDSHTAPLNLEDFIVFGQDRNDGPDDSLWRTGSKSNGNRTLASWIVSLPPAAPPELFVRLANPGEPERTMRMTLDRPFWKSINDNF
jgi:isopenicillin-N N-acyltransferase-like protein